MQERSSIVHPIHIAWKFTTCCINTYFAATMEGVRKEVRLKKSQKISEIKRFRKICCLFCTWLAAAICSRWIGNASDTENTNNCVATVLNLLYDDSDRNWFENKKGEVWRKEVDGWGGFPARSWDVELLADYSSCASLKKVDASPRQIGHVRLVWKRELGQFGMLEYRRTIFCFG